MKAPVDPNRKPKDVTTRGGNPKYLNRESRIIPAEKRKVCDERKEDERSKGDKQ